MASFGRRSKKRRYNSISREYWRAKLKSYQRRLEESQVRIKELKDKIIFWEDQYNDAEQHALSASNRALECEEVLARERVIWESIFKRQSHQLSMLKALKKGEE